MENEELINIQDVNDLPFGITEEELENQEEFEEVQDDTN